MMPVNYVILTNHMDIFALFILISSPPHVLGMSGLGPYAVNFEIYGTEP